MRKYIHLCATLITAILFSVPSAADAENKACSVGPLVTTFYLQNFEVKDCENGDTVHLQVDNTMVARSSVIAIVCDLSKNVVIERSGNIDHIVCVMDLKQQKRTTFKTYNP